MIRKRSTALERSVKIFYWRTPVALAAVGSGVVAIDSSLIVTPIVGFYNCSMFWCALLCVHSSFAIISMGKRELVALLCLSSWCLVIVVQNFITMERVCLQFVIVAFPDHTISDVFLSLRMSFLG